jgi:hypothetical protein
LKEKFISKYGETGRIVFSVLVISSGLFGCKDKPSTTSAPETATTAVTGWNKTLTELGFASGDSVYQTSDRGYVITGFVGSADAAGIPSQGVLLVKTDSIGNIVWHKNLGDNGFGSSVIQLKDGGFAVTGTSANKDGSSPVNLIKTDSSGNMLWEKDLGIQIGYSVIQSADGSIVVTGISTDKENVKESIVLVKTDAAGNLLWTKTFSDLDLGQAHAVIQSADGGFVILGEGSNYGNGTAVIELIKTDSGGNVLWSKNLSGAGSSIVQTDDGGFIITGSSGSSVLLLKTDSIGNTLWNKTYDSASGREYGLSVIQSADGGFVISGYINGPNVSDALLIKTDSSGIKLWEKTFGGKGAESGGSVIRSKDGGLVIAGSTTSTDKGTPSIFFIKTDSLGNN